MSSLPKIISETISECVSIRAQEGTIKGVLAYPELTSSCGRIVVVGPHPLLGGTMENNVVHGLAEGLAEIGWVTLRFDYRSVSESESRSMCDAQAIQSFWETSEVPNEEQLWRNIDDVVQFLTEAGDNTSPLVLVAYSFGNYVVSNWLRECRCVDAVICIAPTLERHDLSCLANSAIPKLAIASEADFATSNESSREMLSRWINTTCDFATKRDGHFFRGHESWLCERLNHFLVQVFPNTSY